MVDNVIEQSSGDNWQIYNADCVEAVGNLPDDSVGFSVFSPPFASLYTYSNSERDMGNCASYSDFWEQFSFLVDELFRVIKPGRLVSVHCMNLPTTKTHHGHIGIQDFRGDIIRRYEQSGFHYHSEVCIWKDPVTAMQRTKAIGLLHKQLSKDSCMSRQGVPDYVCSFRKPGENAEPVSGELDYFAGDQSTFRSEGRLSIDVWQRYASPVWMDINPSNTLQYTTARDEEDERHICPLQLDVIERCTQLWSNPGDVILSPFAGIGSEGHVAIKTGRKFIGVELKPSYYRIACKNMRAAEDSLCEKTLF
jgi:DNA modification methylase